ncbi:hypothetical protein [Stigmatella aurantiaca]|uniref:Uncharacterized protein n=1 Tax=Stigmatella aurantiaca (strain DW4/3-1) TaxID=378806 RepID=Q08X31_STIAD|nr:hypothetical protein [Stigmatella aurantiaca]EAU65023.1 hypothetical protein STIAU_3162 [Stigmatella aurantiaca DW4/3-1]
MSTDKKQSPRHPPTQAELDNRAQHLQPENERYWKARGYAGRPEDWQSRGPEHQAPPKKK